MDENNSSQDETGNERSRMASEQVQSGQSPWKRLLYMFLFLVILNIAELIILVIVVAQFIGYLATGQTNQYLRQFSRSLAKYIGDAIRYVTFCSEDKPFPFRPWPE